MFIKTRIGLSIAALFATSLALGACAVDPGDDTGTALAAINNVPSDGSVACIAVTATGSWATTQSFDVLPGQSTVFTLTGIPIGTVRFDGAAFATSCAQVTPMSTPTWVSTPVLASVAIGQTTAVALNLQQAGSAGVGVGFTPAPSCRTAGLPCLTNAECCSSSCNANNTCAASAPVCVPANGVCAQSSDCCSGQCTSNVCQSACVVPSDCPGSDTECSVRTCTAGACGVAFTPAGSPISVQTAGDCHLNACDGTGNVVSLTDASDVPVDNNQCTIELCAGGVPSFVPAAFGAACNQNGGTTCDGAGNCVALALCGDGVVQPGEGCDDGNAQNGDGCSAFCVTEGGYSCSGSPSVCVPFAICGDGVVQPGEGCDDGNNVNGDGCAAFCVTESGFSCSGSPSVCAPIAICGDGIVQPGEGCDDGNSTNGDGCAAFCVTESGFSCSGSPSVCTPVAVCGDGILQIGEQCDDGNTVNGDGCSAACLIAEVEPNDTIAQATQLPAGNTQVFGSHQIATDADYYAINVPQGGSIRAEIIEGDASKTCGAMDSLLTLFNAAGTTLASDDDGGAGVCSLIDGTGSNPPLAGAHALPAGTYYLRVTSFGQAPTNANTFNYLLVINIL